MDPKQKLIDSARGVFLRFGFRHASMAMIAEDAGVSRQAIYHHFSSKEILFVALVEQLQTAAFENARAAAMQAEASGLKAMLTAALTAYHTSFIQSVAGSPYANELMEESLRHCADAVSKHAQSFESLLSGFVKQAVKNGTAEMKDGLNERQCIQLLLTASKGVKVMHSASAPKVFGQALEQMTSVICDGAFEAFAVERKTRLKTLAGRARS